MKTTELIQKLRFFKSDNDVNLVTFHTHDGKRLVGQIVMVAKTNQDRTTLIVVHEAARQEPTKPGEVVPRRNSFLRGSRRVR